MPPTTTQRRKTEIDIDSLSAEQKAQLLNELQAERQADAEVEADARNEALKLLMADRDHLRDCPTGRTEMYSATAPAQPRKGIGPKEVTVIRCQECGGSTVLDQSYDDSVEQLGTMISETTTTEEVEEP